MRALITGAAGFIGSNLVDRLLADGHDVVGVDCFTDYYDRAIKRSNLDAALAHGRFALVEEDLLTCDLDSLLDGVDVVFHQAGTRSPALVGGWIRDLSQSECACHRTTS